MGPYHFGTLEVSGVTVLVESPPLNPTLVIGERKQPVQRRERPGRKQIVNFSRTIRRRPSSFRS